jgi:outer membrane immunogenic protein
MRKMVLFACLASAALAAPAMAADMAVKAPLYKAPPPPPVFSWTGCYIGGFGGGLWLQKDYTLTASTPVPAGVPLPAALGTHNASSGIGGIQAGCNYQFAGGWVVGIQGDYGWTGAKGSHIDPVLGTSTVSSNTKSLGSVTGRIGYAWDRFLGYVKGGAAWEQDDYSWVSNTGPPFALTGSETRGGWTVGVGGEYAFLDWLTGFVEYDYYNFGTRNVGLPGFVNGGTPNTVFFDIRERKSVVKAGLNFKFGGGPVVARY